ncbi:uncharacterized protein [Haliotis asinina]|uniref:uncharacterized protein isoform X2 n=1 Tax=Haliotis asinina TaxID=109174 RepID=UPI0035318F6D
MLPSFGLREQQSALWQTMTYICGKRQEECPITCTCRLPNSKFCILRETEVLVDRSEKNIRKPKSWVSLGIGKQNSSSTPTVPFSTADLLYNPEVSRPAPSADDFSTTDLVYFDREKDKLKLRDIDANRRSTSRNNSRRSISLEKVNFEGEKDELRPIKNTFPTTKGQNPGRTNGVRGTLLRSDQLLNHKNNVQGREPDDLVAMGTIWSPNLQQRNSTTTSTTTSSKSFSLTSTSNTSNVNPRKGPSATTTRVGFPNNFSTSRSTAKDSEPKYTDPVSGASPSFQQRLMELSALEAETVRWERTKKIKKKSKQDRDS